MAKDEVGNKTSMFVLLLCVGFLFKLAMGTAIPAVTEKPPLQELPQVHLSLRAQEEIRQLEVRIDNAEAAALADLTTSPDHARRVALLGKLLLFDKNLSVNRNEACAFCHMPETGFGAPVSELNMTTVSYPGSVRTRFSNRMPQAHEYATYSPVLHYNAMQGDFVGGSFWDMRATSIRLNSPVAQQAQGPPLNPVEMGLIDSACMVYRASQRPYRVLEKESGACRHLLLNGRRISIRCAAYQVRRALPIRCPFISA
jgi:cytochrome c peroxidase